MHFTYVVCILEEVISKATNRIKYMYLEESTFI